MKWKKLGHIFSPNGEQEWMRSHAAVPIADHLRDDIFRIYFSTRDKANRANVAWIEIDLNNPTKILALSEQPVLKHGPIGHFDDSGTMLSCITRHNGMDYWYYIGWNLGVTVPFRNSIGLAIFSDQKLIKRYPGPILDRNKDEPNFNASCYVMPGKDKWRMWYLSCIKWEHTNAQHKHFYNIKYAESIDGIDWERNGIIAIDFESDEEYAISRPSVIFENDIYHMWYSYRGERYHIGYAQSQDGISWERQDHKTNLEASKQGWDSESVEYPFVFDHKGQRYMLYNGNGYGKTGFGLAVLESK
jgi:predicted GH43/DUF377 family glycosyl hydrolase